MDERLYSINEFLLSSLNDVSEQNNPQNNQSNTCKSDLIHNDIRNKGLVPLENVHSQEEEGESAFHTRQGSFADSDSLYTEDSSLEGSCTFLEFLKDCEPQDSKSEIHSFMHQRVRRNSRTSVLTSAFDEEITLLEFLSGPEIKYQDVTFNEFSSPCSPFSEPEEFEMISLSQFLSESSDQALNSSPALTSSSRASSASSIHVPEKRTLLTPSTRSSSDASWASDRSCTGISKCSRDSGIKCTRDSVTKGTRESGIKTKRDSTVKVSIDTSKSSKKAYKDSKRMSSKLETIVSPTGEDIFSFYELVARPELCQFEEKNRLENKGLLGQIMQPFLSTKTVKPRPSLTTSCKSLDSTGGEGTGANTEKSSNSVRSSEASLNHGNSETSLDSAPEEDCTLLEFLQLEPPPDYLTSYSAALLSLHANQPLFHNSQPLYTKPLYDTNQPIFRAKSEEDLATEYSLAEFLSSPHLNPSPQKPLDPPSGLFAGFNLTKSLRQLSLGSVTVDRDLTFTDLLALRRGSILDDLLGGQMSSPDKAGHLKKQGNSRLRDWKTRYCAVKDGTFCYYESYEAYCIATPINSIYCGTLKAQISDRARFKFEVIVPNRTYYFLAQSESEMMSWIESLTAAVAAALTDFKSSGSTAKELIQRIHEEPSNAFCADCNAPDPKWASINLGVVVCIKCSGSHRILGVHISKVRSLELDVKAWTDDMVSVFHRVGNRRANEFFESTLDPSHPRPSPDSDMKVRESFIEEKYTRGTWSATICAPAAELDQQLIQVVQTDELDKTLALLMSGADVKYIDTSEDASRRTPYLMALASGQKAQAQLLLLNDADPVLPQENNESSDIDMTVDMEGVLEKRGPTSIQPYKRRKCVLTGKLMRYFDDSSLKNEIDLHTMIDVEMGQSEQPDDEKQSEEYSYLRVRTDLRTYIFRDRDRDYISRWYDALKSTQVFGVPIDKQPKTPNGIPLFIHKCIIFLENKLDSEGIYRVSGVKTRIEKLRLAFNQRIHDVILTDAENPTNDVTSLLKQYFRELPESLLGSWNSALTDAVQIDDETERLYQIQDLIYELPGTEFHTLKILIQHLYNVAQQQPLNKMNSENIGVIFGPTLMSVHDPGSDFNCYEYQLISTLIDYFPWVFQVDIEEEATKGKELKLAEAELRKIMSSIDAPHGSAENSWIVEVFHKHNSVNIRIESGQKLRDVSAEILTRSKLADGDFALHEFLCNGQLQRPIHLSEYLLNTTVTLWDERVHRSWLAIDYNNLKERLKVCDSIPLDATEQGSLHLYEGKKKWKEVHCKLSHDNFTFSKLKVKTTLNLLNYTWYLGSEANVASPTRFCFSLRCLNPTKDHKEEIFKVFCAPDEFELWRWLSRINSVKVKEPDYRLVRSKRANLQNPNNRNSFILLER